MTSARELISPRIVVGSPEERLIDLAPKLVALCSHHCSVVDSSGKFIGVIRMADIAGFTQAGNRILADLVSPVQPLVVRSSEPAEAIFALFTKHRLYEAVVLADTGEYVGLATAESVMEFVLQQLTSKDDLLQQTRMRLDAASNAKDIFLRSLSHELRTPLNPVLLLASEGAANPELPQAVREQFEVIATSALLEAHLIDGLLDLTRLDRGTIRLERQLVDVQAMLNRIVGELQPDAVARDLTIQAELPSEPAEVLGDAPKLEQAFRNLLRHSLNSIDGSGRVRVESRRNSDGSRITILLSDNGRGLSELELEHTFDPFPLLNQPAVGSKGGGKLAIGLTLARAIVSLHSGSLTAGSEGPGKGSSFKIELPLVSARGAESTNEVASPTVPKAKASQT